MIDLFLYQKISYFFFAKMTPNLTKHIKTDNMSFLLSDFLSIMLYK